MQTTLYDASTQPAQWVTMKTQFTSSNLILLHQMELIYIIIQKEASRNVTNMSQNIVFILLKVY